MGMDRPCFSLWRKIYFYTFLNYYFWHQINCRPLYILWTCTKNQTSWRLGVKSYDLAKEAKTIFWFKFLIQENRKQPSSKSIHLFFIDVTQRDSNVSLFFPQASKNSNLKPETVFLFDVQIVLNLSGKS